MSFLTAGVALTLAAAGVAAPVTSPAPPADARPAAGMRSAAAAARNGKLDSLGWLAGTWRGRDGAAGREERWLAPAGGLMLGLHRDLEKGKAAGFEFLRIEAQESGIVYLASPGGRCPATPFPLKGVDGQRAVFENPAHDFPKRIVYWREGDVLHARVEGGKAGAGDAAPIEWTFSREVESR